MTRNQNNSRNQNGPVIIGIDAGYGNVKTRNFCFKTGVSSYDKEPTFKGNLLVYGGRYYVVGEEHKEFTTEKFLDNDNYILTLAAIARKAVEMSLGTPGLSFRIWKSSH